MASGLNHSRGKIKNLITDAVISIGKNELFSKESGWLYYICVTIG
jgi:hypothetical protein